MITSLIGFLATLTIWQIGFFSVGVFLLIFAAIGTWWAPEIRLTESGGDNQAEEREELPWATQEELAQPYVHGRRFRLVDVPIPTRETRIVGKTWDACLVEGPAVIWLNKSQLFHSTIVVPDPSNFEGALWERTGDELVQGGIAVEECSIRNCVIRNVGFMGTKEQLDKLRENVSR